jgi:DNA-binding response OmpR family regulator
MLKIAVLEDNDLVREELISFLSRPDRSVTGFGTATGFFVHLREDVPHITILDLGLPDLDGLDVARRLRKSHASMGLIILTARTHGNDRSHGYEIGADIFLTKPTNVRELEAVVQNLADRILRAEASTIPFDFELQREALRIRRPAGPWVALTKTEAKLLECLSLAPQRELATQALLDRLAANGSATLTRETLAVLISRLRSKIRGDDTDLITAVRGYGYRLTTELLLTPEAHIP